MSKKLKVCHLTSVHKRYDIRIFIKQCKSLHKNGCEVYLIVADGLGDEIVDGINVLDVGKEKGRLRRFIFSTRKVYHKAKSLKCDIYHFHDPELMFYGLKLKSRKSKVIYDIHEDLVQQLKIKPWIPNPLRPLVAFIFKKTESYIGKRMNALIVPQPYMKTKYLRINKKTELVENFVILKEEQDIGKKDYNNHFAFHPGALSVERGLINMINVYNLLETPNKLILAGNIKEELLTEVVNINGWERVSYLGVISYNEVEKYYLRASIGLILYNNVGQYHLSYAIKLFEYMKNGIPVIMPNFGEWIKFNEENKCGINVDVSNPKAVADKINSLNSNPIKKKELGVNGRNAVLNKYNWAISEKKLLNLYASL